MCYISRYSFVLNTLPISKQKAIHRDLQREIVILLHSFGPSDLVLSKLSPLFEKKKPVNRVYQIWIFAVSYKIKILQHVFCSLKRKFLNYNANTFFSQSGLRRELIQNSVDITIPNTYSSVLYTTVRHCITWICKCYICSCVHRSYRLKKSNEMQKYADIYLLLNYSTWFGRPSHPPSGVHKTVVTASGTDHTVNCSCSICYRLYCKL